jgi:ATP-binding cassette subfamily B protein
VVLQAVLAPLQLLLIKGVIDRTVLDLGVRTHTPEAFVLRLPFAGWIAAAALVIAAARLVQPLASTLQEMAGDRLGGYFEEQIIQATNRWRGLARFEDPRFADDLELVRSHAGDYSLGALLYGTRAAISLATAIGAMLILARLNPLAPVLLVLASAPQMGQEWLYRHRTGSHLYVQTPQARRLRYSREAMLAPEPAKDVHLYALGGYFLDLYRRVFTRTMSDLDGLRKRMAVRVSATSALAAAAAGAVYLYVVHSVAGGALSIGDLALYGGAVGMLASNLQMLGFDMASCRWRSGSTSRPWRACSKRLPTCRCPSTPYRLQHPYVRALSSTTCGSPIRVSGIRCSKVYRSPSARASVWLWSDATAQARPRS